MFIFLVGNLKYIIKVIYVQCVHLRPAAIIVTRSLLEIQTLRSSPDLPSQNLHFTWIPR